MAGNISLKDSGSSNASLSKAQKRNLSPISINAKAYTYRITGKAEVKYLKEKNDESIPLSDYIISMDLIEMYDKADICSCNLTLGISSSIYRSFQDDYRNTRIILSIDRYESIDRNTDRKPVSIWKDKPFIIVGIPKAAPSEDASGKEPTNTSTSDSITRVTFALVDEDGFNSNRNLFNFIAKDATVGDVLQYLISKSSRNKRICVGKPSNTQKYEQILIPPMNFQDAIEYLDTNYGIYKNGAIYFTSVDALTICDRVEKVKSQEDPVTDITIVFQNGSTSGPQSGMFKSTAIDKDQATIYTVSRPVIAIKDVTLKEIFGEKITLNFKNSQNDIPGGGGVKSDFKPKEKYFWSGINREDLGSAVAMEINEVVEAITIDVDNSDMNLFDIAKNIKIKFDYDVNRDYTGEYRLLNNKHTFISVEPSEDVRDSGKLMKLITKFSIVRV
jgi:hypothetical protein